MKIPCLSKCIFIIFLLFFLSEGRLIYGQYVISGRIFNAIDNQPVPGVKICQEGGQNCNYSDWNGAFHLLIFEQFENRVIFQHKDFQTGEIKLLEQDGHEFYFYMNPITGKSSCENKPEREWTFFTGFNAEIFQNDFIEFEDLLGRDNKETLDLSGNITGVLAGFSYKRHVWTIETGFITHYNDNSEQDSLDIKSVDSGFGLMYGYRIIDQDRITLMPEIAVKWHHYRLINSMAERRIALENYLTDPALDLRFSQFIACAGLSLTFNFYQYGMFYTDYWSFGLKGGYATRLNRESIILTKGNRLLTGRKIQMDPFYFGIFFTFHIE